VTVEDLFKVELLNLFEDSSRVLLEMFIYREIDRGRDYLLPYVIPPHARHALWKWRVALEKGRSFVHR
jgi:hypothetical protein